MQWFGADGSGISRRSASYEREAASGDEKEPRLSKEPSRQIRARQDLSPSRVTPRYFEAVRDQEEQGVDEDDGPEDPALLSSAGGIDQGLGQRVPHVSQRGMHVGESAVVSSTTLTSPNLPGTTIF